MTDSDVEAVVSLHIRAFPGFFLSVLGHRVLREFYRSFCFDSSGVALVAEDVNPSRIVGVVAGPVVPEGYFRRLLANRWWAFCLACASAVVRNPRIVPRLWRALSYRGAPPDDRPRALLSSIAVSPEARNRGFGLLLVNAWVDAVRMRGATGCYLTTDAENNNAVNRFYERAGWMRQGSFKTLEGRRMNMYVLDWVGDERGIQGTGLQRTVTGAMLSP
ncbi:MAG: GNAT family N-acetyltransferase [bacterium]